MAMSMKAVADQYEVAPGYEDLFEMSQAEQDTHEAQMLSFRILSEVQKTLEARGMTRKQLASELGTSASYLTQLFRGDKLLNLPMIVKLERVLGLKSQVVFRMPSIDKAALIRAKVEAETKPKKPRRKKVTES